MTYVESQPPVVVTRDEIREIAECAWAVLDSNPSARLREIARNVISWADGTLLSGENDSTTTTVIRMRPLTFDIKDYYTREHLPKVLDQTPDPVISAQPIYAVMMYQLAEFLDTDWYSTEARLEALADYEDVVTRLALCTDEYLADPDPDPDDEPSDDEEHGIERSTNFYGTH